MTHRWPRSVWRSRARLVAAVLPAALVLGVFLHYYGDFVSDDAYISFRYAENLATGRGLEWNPGYRVEGYSNFLWVVSLAGLRVLGVPVPEAARALAWASALVTLLLIVLLAGRERIRPSLLPLALTPLLVALAFPYQYWSALRLETAFFAMLLLLGVLLFVREEEGHGVARWPSALVFLAVALTRPEAPLYIAVPGLYLLARLRSAHDLGQLLRQRGLWAAIFVGGMVAFLAWRVIYFGDILPNTYYAKVGGDGLLELGWSYLQRFALQRPYPLVWLAGILILGGAGSRAVQLILGTVLLQALIAVLVGGDWMREFRLLVPSIPLLAAGLGVSIQRFLRERPLTTRASATIGLALLCLGVQGSMGTPFGEWDEAWRARRAPAVLDLEGEMTRASEAVGRWLREHAEPDALVAVNHAGAVPFYSRLPTIDMAALNDLHIARVSGRRHQKWDPDYVMGREPEFLVLNMRRAPKNGEYVPGYWGGETALVRHPDFKRYYVLAAEPWKWRHRALELRLLPADSTSYILVYRRDEARYERLGECQDFEEGYGSWKTEGEAFGSEPARGGVGFQRVEGFLGRRLANSYASVPRGSDGPQGALRSPPFELRGTHLELQVGGGADRRVVGVQLLLDGAPVQQVAGNNDERLRHVIWDVRALEGREVVLEIYDRSSGRWGHVLADTLCQFRRAPGGADGGMTVVEPPPPTTRPASTPSDAQ